jgi:hypothetical protein
LSSEQKPHAEASASEYLSTLIRNGLADEQLGAVLIPGCAARDVRHAVVARLSEVIAQHRFMGSVWPADNDWSAIGAVLPRTGGSALLPAVHIGTTRVRLNVPMNVYGVPLLFANTVAHVRAILASHFVARKERRRVEVSLRRVFLRIRGLTQRRGATIAQLREALDAVLVSWCPKVSKDNRIIAVERLLVLGRVTLEVGPNSDLVSRGRQGRKRIRRRRRQKRAP